MKLFNLPDGVIDSRDAGRILGIAPFEWPYSPEVQTVPIRIPAALLAFYVSGAAAPPAEGGADYEVVAVLLDDDEADPEMSLLLLEDD